jgi:carotenoid 1,2-hydratase
MIRYVHEPVSPLLQVAPGGYAWWYFDALSDDGERALAAIFFIGSVFSPRYAERLRRGEPARAEEHLGVNLALYTRGRQAAWVMSEYGASALVGGDDAGPHINGSRIERMEGNGGLRLCFEERTAPFLVALARVGAPVAGSVELEPLAPPLDPVALAAPSMAGKTHGWRVVMPRARVRVRFDRPGFAFDGIGYHDVNHGDGRLEAAFSRWSWARFHDGDRTRVVYAITERGGRARAWLVDARDGAADRATREVAAATCGASRPWGWGLSVPSQFTVEDGGRRLDCRPEESLESSPFYARYRATLREGDGPPARGLGEHLDFERFSGRGIQFLLHFKTRRVS